jgi:predicted O-methyltransferase YrrM
MRGWAGLSRRLALDAAWARHHKPEFIVECGSGVSTILFGYHMQSTGSGKVVSLEHDPRFATRTRDLAQQHGVADVIEVRDAPLRAWHDGGQTWDWYDPSVVDDIAEIDLLFIEGPPSTTGGLARYPAGPLLFDRLAPGGIAVLDDTLRDDERRASQLWLEQIEGLERERLKTDKGTDVLRRRAD